MNYLDHLAIKAPSHYEIRQPCMMPLYYRIKILLQIIKMLKFAYISSQNGKTKAVLSTVSNEIQHFYSLDS